MNTGGKLHIYCGDGKGKTTAAVGLALRFLGHKKNVLIVQFLKGRETGELTALAALSESDAEIGKVTVLRLPKSYGFLKQMSESDLRAVKAEHNALLAEAKRLLSETQVDLLILDELLSAYEHEVVDRDAAKALVFKRPEALEVVLTGRYAAPVFTDAADYISRIDAVRHPYEHGLQARVGVEY